MFKRRSSYTSTGSGIPLFFKLWFAVCATLALGIISASIFLLYTLITDPSIIGRYAGEITQAYTDTVSHQQPEISQ